MHDPGKIMANLAVRAALGGHCLSDLSPLRCDKELFGACCLRPHGLQAGGDPGRPHQDHPPGTGPDRADLMLLLCVKGGEVLVVAVCELG